MQLQNRANVSTVGHRTTSSSRVSINSPDTGFWVLGDGGGSFRRASCAVQEAGEPSHKHTKGAVGFASLSGQFVVREKAGDKGSVHDLKSEVKLGYLITTTLLQLQKLNFHYMIPASSPILPCHPANHSTARNKTKSLVYFGKCEGLCYEGCAHNQKI